LSKTETTKISSLDTKSSSIQNPPSTYRESLTTHYTEIEYQAVLDMYNEIDLVNHYGRLLECRTQAYFVRDIETGLVKVLSKSCHVRFCPFCSRTRGFRIKKNTANWLKTCTHPKFITLTLRHNSLSLKSQFQRLYDCFRELRRLKLWKSAIKGAIWFFEIKYNEKGEWHPHLHVVADGLYLSQSKLSAEWLRLTVDSPVVDIRSVKDPEKVAEYVSKYATKPCQLFKLELPQRIELYNALKKRRLVGAIGTAHKARITAKPDFDETKFEKIGQWSTVAGLFGYDENADAIWNAYKTKAPLDKSFSCYKIDYMILGIPPPEEDIRKHIIKEWKLW